MKGVDLYDSGFELGTTFLKGCDVAFKRISPVSGCDMDQHIPQSDTVSLLGDNLLKHTICLLAQDRPLVAQTDEPAL